MQTILMTIQYTGEIRKKINDTPMKISNVMLIWFQFKNDIEFAEKYSKHFNDAVQNVIDQNEFLTSNAITVQHFVPTMVNIIRQVIATND